MEKSILILVIFFPAVIFGGRSSSSESSEENGSIPLLTKMYCQTDYVIKNNLIQLTNRENGFRALAENPDTVDCFYVLSQSSMDIYKKLEKELKRKNYNKKTYRCTMGRLRAASYDKFRFKINALLGLDLPNEEKMKLHDHFNYEIATLTERSVNDCSVATVRPKPASSSSSSEEKA